MLEDLIVAATNEAWTMLSSENLTVIKRRWYSSVSSNTNLGSYTAKVRVEAAIAARFSQAHVEALFAVNARADPVMAGAFNGAVIGRVNFERLILEVWPPFFVPRETREECFAAEEALLRVGSICSQT